MPVTMLVRRRRVQEAFNPFEKSTMVRFGEVRKKCVEVFIAAEGSAIDIAVRWHVLINVRCTEIHRDAPRFKTIEQRSGHIPSFLCRPLIAQCESISSQRRHFLLSRTTVGGKSPRIPPTAVQIELFRVMLFKPSDRRKAHVLLAIPCRIEKYTKPVLLHRNGWLSESPGTVHFDELHMIHQPIIPGKNPLEPLMDIRTPIVRLLTGRSLDHEVPRLLRFKRSLNQRMLPIRTINKEEAIHTREICDPI